MFHFRQEDPDLNEAIASAFADLEHKNAADPEYKKIVSQLSKLYALKRKPVDIDPNKLALIASNVFVALCVIKYEQTGVITSRVMSFMSKI